MSESASFWTGLVCQQPGEYRSDCLCGRNVTMKRGERFPQCPTCRQDVTWRPAGATGAAGPAK